MMTKRKKIPQEFVLNFYDAVLRESSLAEVAAAMGLTRWALQKKINRSDDLQKAFELATERRKKNRLPDYVYRSLSQEARNTWEEIKEKAKSPEAIEQLFKDRPKALRQELFIHALISSKYDMSKACRLVGMSRAGVEKWKKDLHFLQLLEEVHFHKKNFFEKALISLVEERHPGAVLFVNKTMNADRGYSEKLHVEHTTQQGTINLDDLQLDIQTRKKLLEAVRTKRLQEQNTEQEEDYEAIPV